MNPLAVLISAFQDVLFFNRLPHWLPSLGLLVFACVVLSVATTMFTRYKQTFAEANGIILGLSKKQIRRRFDEIVQFAGAMPQFSWRRDA